MAKLKIKVNVLNNKVKSPFSAPSVKTNRIVSNKVREEISKKVSNNKEFKEKCNNQMSRVFTREVKEFVNENTRTVKVIKKRAVKATEKLKTEELKQQRFEFIVHHDRVVDLYKYIAIYFLRLIINSPVDDEYKYYTYYKTTGYDNEHKRYVTVKTTVMEDGKKKVIERREPKKSEVHKYERTHEADEEYMREKWIIKIGNHAFSVKDIKIKGAPKNWWLSIKTLSPDLVNNVANYFMAFNHDPSTGRLISPRNVSVSSYENSDKLYVIEEGAYKSVNYNSSDDEGRIGKKYKRKHGLKKSYSVQAPRGVIKLTNAEFEAISRIEDMGMYDNMIDEKIKKSINKLTSSELALKQLSGKRKLNKDGTITFTPELYTGVFKDQLKLDGFQSKTYTLQVEFEKAKKREQKDFQNRLKKQRKKHREGASDRKKKRIYKLFENKGISYDVFIQFYDKEKKELEIDRKEISYDSRDKSTFMQRLVNALNFEIETLNDINGTNYAPVKYRPHIATGNARGLNLTGINKKSNKITITNEVNGTSVEKTVIDKIAKKISFTYGPNQDKEYFITQPPSPYEIDFTELQNQEPDTEKEIYDFIYDEGLIAKNIKGDELYYNPETDSWEEF